MNWPQAGGVECWVANMPQPNWSVNHSLNFIELIGASGLNTASRRPGTSVGGKATRVALFRGGRGGNWQGNQRLRGRRSGFFLLATELVFQLRHAVVEALQNFPRLGGNGHAVVAMMARGGAALDRIFKFLAASPAGARALTGGGWGGHGKANYACRLWTSQPEKSGVIIAITGVRPLEHSGRNFVHRAEIIPIGRRQCEVGGAEHLERHSGRVGDG